MLYIRPAVSDIDLTVCDSRSREMSGRSISTPDSRALVQYFKPVTDENPIFKNKIIKLEDKLRDTRELWRVFRVLGFIRDR